MTNAMAESDGHGSNLGTGRCAVRCAFIPGQSNQPSAGSATTAFCGWRRSLSLVRRLWTEQRILHNIALSLTLVERGLRG